MVESAVQYTFAYQYLRLDLETICDPVHLLEICINGTDILTLIIHTDFYSFPCKSKTTGSCTGVLFHQHFIVTGKKRTFTLFLPCWGGSCAKRSCHYEEPHDSLVSLSSCQCSCLYPPQTCPLDEPVKP